ncbi:cupredoxin domain-containing protein [Amycolatopsis sp. w19]|uniref:cupredoxin domain-containing protein n=1 Tax=Amycolatopsis sp. w19 TaxID=3448134 RepID=UPI003F1D2748
MKRLAGLVLTAAFLILQALCLAPPVDAATQQVMMQDYAYGPAALTVRAGDTVTWMQHDQAPHDVVTTSAPVAFRSPQLSAGQSWSYTFTKPGTYSYYCSVHPDMRATVTVLAAETATKQPSPTPSKQTTARPTASSAPSPSSPPTSSSAAPVSETPAPAPPVTQQAAATGPSLDPMLLVAGVVTAVAVLCLLLVGSRPGG